MASDDDVAYHKSVRNMSLVLAAIVITVFAAIFIPPYLSPQHDVFQRSASLNFLSGFALHLQINSTSVQSDGTLLISGWINSTSSTIDNITTSDSWGVQQGDLWMAPCMSGWPIGLGVMQGHYTADNYSLGAIINVTGKPDLASCPVTGTPNYFLFAPHSSKALVTLNAGPTFWVIQSSFSFGGSANSGTLKPGVYTALLADEWGDVLTTNFLVS
jgi:hypothetical protein